ncbi:hypothetical protein VKT23_014093 [Stygiomarasmius scandens]|uniref:Uncharacterized protein n=1 Tax=Marasmiellus scandens TaxID=2682957 RepID=A0ABR1J2J9_9AGAR
MVNLDSTDIAEQGGDFALDLFANTCAENNLPIDKPTLSVSSSPPSPTDTGSNGASGSTTPLMGATKIFGLCLIIYVVGLTIHFV